ncbi:MAG: alpha-L-fucosidase [Victivallaceae bacterium]|nr:alpha-L-fucosidase [Victivallaceae bacterium]
MNITDKSMIPDKWKWFPECRFGMFIHWGPYSRQGRGEQVLFREHLNQKEYEKTACAWNPTKFNAKKWAETAKSAGMRYAVLTTRHHDGFCLWDSQYTNYSTAKQAAGRDFVKEYVEAFRKAGLRVGLYYSLADWRIPAYWEGPENDSEGWSIFRNYIHNQVRELLSNYGIIDEFWFDGAWPRNAYEWDSFKLVDMMRDLQPNILINNRLGIIPDADNAPKFATGEGGTSKELGDFGTPEHHITPEPDRLWESCQVTTWRLWGYAIGERWRSADLLLDMLAESASKGGNLLLNVGPNAMGEIPEEFKRETAKLGKWLRIHGEAIYDSEGGDICEMVTRGYQVVKGNNLYLIIRFWDGSESLRLDGLKANIRRATLLTTGKSLKVEYENNVIILNGLSSQSPCDLFPVIKLECVEHPTPLPWANARLWEGDPRRMTSWAKARGESVFVGKSEGDNGA